LAAVTGHHRNHDHRTGIFPLATSEPRGSAQTVTLNGGVLVVRYL
jgi:hypothetical protein